MALISTVTAVSVLSSLRAAAARAFRWLVADFWRLVAFVLLIACAALSIRADGLHFGPVQIEGLKDRAHHAESALRIVRGAQDRATAAQAAANHQPAQVSRDIAEASNVQSQSYYEQGRAAAAGYAAGNGVRKACPEGRAAGADLPGTDRATAQHDSAGETADMVAVTRADFDQLTGNSLRLAQVREDAQALIDAGVAEAWEVEPPPDLPNPIPE
ncbi:hypothetical protein BRX37_16585 [Sphingomonas sp. S-NIH.Pt3_0716]|nr:hypothetical protein BRX37_16585 [Sphingomonas sp. S-NIH.Pt3_0716]